MLYPDLEELIGFKSLKSLRLKLACRKVQARIPGNHHSPFRGQGLEFDCVREYVPGDDIRNIDWRVTARTGSPHLKVFKEERERHVVICVDMNAGMQFGTKNTFKSVQAARIASFLGWQAIAEHDRVSACLFGDVAGGLQFFPPKRTAGSFSHVLKALAQGPLERHSLSIEEALKQIGKTTHPGSLVYVISDFLDLESGTEILRLNQKSDLVFIAINDPADQTMFPVGSIEFSHLSETMRVNTLSFQGREAYAAAWKANRKRLYEMAIPLLELSTESDIRRDLPLGLKKLARRRG